MRGYKNMVDEITQLALLAITMNISIIEAALDAMTLIYLGVSLKLMYSFLTGFSSWSGYLIAAVYYFGLDLGYADVMCQVFGYGNLVIYYLNLAITFGQSAS